MPTVTSENKAEFDKEFMEKRSNSTMKDPASYRSFARDAAKQSEKAETAAQHHEAMGSHKHAAMYAAPHPVHKEHEEKAKFHAAEHRKMQKLEQDRYIKANLESGKAKHAEFMRKGDEKRRKAGTL
jgi:hypothetical protein